MQPGYGAQAATTTTTTTTTQNQMMGGGMPMGAPMMQPGYNQTMPMGQPGYMQPGMGAPMPGAYQQPYAQPAPAAPQAPAPAVNIVINGSKSSSKDPRYYFGVQSFFYFIILAFIVGPFAILVCCFPCDRV